MKREGLVHRSVVNYFLCDVTANAAAAFLVKLEQRRSRPAGSSGNLRSRRQNVRRGRGTTRVTRDTGRTATWSPPSEMTAEGGEREKRGCDKRPDHSTHLLKQGAGREERGRRAGAKVTKESHRRVAGNSVSGSGKRGTGSQAAEVSSRYSSVIKEKSLPCLRSLIPASQTDVHSP